MPDCDIPGECIFDLPTAISSNSQLRESNKLAKDHNHGLMREFTCKDRQKPEYPSWFSLSGLSVLNFTLAIIPVDLPAQFSRDFERDHPPRSLHH